MRIQSVRQNTYEKNSNPTFKMILVKELSRGFEPDDFDKLVPLIRQIEPKDQKVGLRLLVSKDANSPTTDIEIVSGNLKLIGQVPFNYTRLDIKKMLQAKYNEWSQNISNILLSLGFDNSNSTLPK